MKELYWMSSDKGLIRRFIELTWSFFGVCLMAL